MSGWHGGPVSGPADGDVDGQITALERVRDAAGDRLGALAAREIGRLAHRELPAARTAVLQRPGGPGQGFTSLVTFLDAAGQDLGGTPAGQQLAELAGPYCAYLEDANEAGWSGAAADPPAGYPLPQGRRLLNLRAARWLDIPPGPFVAAPPARVPRSPGNGPALEA